MTMQSFLSLASFFRGIPDSINYPFSIWHLLIFITYTSGYLGLLLAMRKRIKAGKPRTWVFRTLETGLSLTLLLVVISLYSWYALSGYGTDPLPLYHCRMAMIFLVLAALRRLFHRHQLGNFYVQWAVAMATFGSWMAMILPDMDPFSFPHITNFTYMLGHFALGYLAIVHLCLWPRRPNFRDWRNAQIFLFLFNLSLLLFDRVTGDNYGFFNTVPFLGDLLTRWGAFLFYPAILFTYALLFTLFWLLNRFLWDWLHCSPQI